MKEAARELRKHPTVSESRLWQALRGARLDGRKFRGQQPIGPFVVDFHCSDEKLVVEVDGGVHEHQREEDARRQEAIESEGLRFVRLSHDQVMQDLPAGGGGSPRHVPRPAPGVEVQPPWPSEEAIAEFRRTDPATQWMLRQMRQREVAR